VYHKEDSCTLFWNLLILLFVVLSLITVTLNLFKNKKVSESQYCFHTAHVIAIHGIVMWVWYMFHSFHFFIFQPSGS